MIEEKKFEGNWFIEEQSKDKNDWIGGVLEYHPIDGATLTLFEPLENERRPQIERIYGRTIDGDEITLRNCFLRARSRSQGTVTSGSVKFDIQQIIVGGILPEDSLQFNKVKIEIESLIHWRQSTGIHIDEAFFQEVENPNVNFSARYENLDSKELSIQNSTIRIQTAADFTVQRIGGLSIDEKSYFELVSSDKEHYSLDQTLTFVRRLQNFVALGLNKPIQPSKITAIPLNHEKPVEILPGINPTPENRGSFHPSQANFLENDLEDVEATLSNWWETIEDLQPVFNLYFSSLYYNLPLQIHYRTLCAALEAYFVKVLEPDRQDARDQIKTFAAQLKQSSEDDLLNSEVDGIVESISELEIAFNSQLREIVDAHEELFRRLSGDFRATVDDITDRPFTTQTSDSTIYRQSRALKAILEGVLLREIEIEDDLIIAAIDSQYNEF